MQSSSRPWGGRVISIISPMGGDGRTTLCANVSVALARLGKETIAVDADIVNRSLSRVMGLENCIASGWLDVMEEACSLSKACIRHRDVPGLQFLSIGHHVQNMAVMENMKPDPEVMRRACDDLRSLGDFIVIDTPPGYGGGLEMATAADEVIVVVIPMSHTVDAAKRMIEAVKLLDKRSMRLVINHMQPGKNRHCDENDGPDVNGILEILPLDLLGIVPEDDYVVASSRRGEFAALDPGSPAGREYQNIVRRLLGEEVPFMKFKS